jgi:tryptophanyl-tRNA synthetase
LTQSADTFAIGKINTMTDAQNTPADGAPPAVEETATAPQSTSKQDINPWSVSGEVGEDGKVKAIDYRKLVEDFGTSLIDDKLLERFEKVTGHKPHRFMRRQIVFSHRDLTTILDRYEKAG